VDLGDRGGSFSDTRRHTFDRSRPRIADGENTWTAGFQRQARRAAGRNEAFLIQGDTAIEPLGVWIGADEQEHICCAFTVQRSPRRDARSTLSSVPSSMPDKAATVARTRNSIFDVAAIRSIR
jgi:hypothetical protein